MRPLPPALLYGNSVQWAYAQSVEELQEFLNTTYDKKMAKILEMFERHDKKLLDALKHCLHLAIQQQQKYARWTNVLSAWARPGIRWRGMGQGRVARVVAKPLPAVGKLPDGGGATFDGYKSVVGLLWADRSGWLAVLTVTPKKLGELSPRPPPPIFKSALGGAGASEK